MIIKADLFLFSPKQNRKKKWITRNSVSFNIVCFMKISINTWEKNNNPKNHNRLYTITKFRAHTQILLSVVNNIYINRDKLWNKFLRLKGQSLRWPKQVLVNINLL